MAACYRDRAGRWHAFVDHIDAGLGTAQSWPAEIRYYTSDDCLNFTDRGVVVPRGAQGDCDDYGAASPCLYATDEAVYLFYGARRLADADTHRRAGVHSGQGLEIQVAACVARADADGAPTGPFTKKGVIASGSESIAAEYVKQAVEPDSAVSCSGTHWLFHSGIGLCDGKAVKKAVFRRRLELPSLATGPAEQIYAPPGGGELCRYFRHQGRWQIFYRLFDRSDGGADYRHWVSDDLLAWTKVDDHLFRSHTPHPDSAADIGIVYGLEGKLADPPTILATGLDDGVLKIWRYHLMGCEPLEA
jgi:hypothetical protein